VIDDGRLLVLLGLAGVAGATIVRGSRGIARSGRSVEMSTWYVEVTFSSGDDANANSDDLVALIEGIDGVFEIDNTSFVDYRDGEGDTVHVSFIAPEDTVPAVESAVENWVGSREGAFWPGSVEAE
jgi:hypothetical protein